MKSNRKLSFLIVFFVYVLATVGGIFVYNVLNFEPWLSLLIADILATVIVFLFSLIFKNASVYDPYWSVQPIVIVVAFAFSYKVSTLSLLMIFAVCLWGIRLTANWAYTFHSLNHQDWRYSMLKEKTGRAYPLINFLGIHMFPTLVVYACVLPVVYAIIMGTSINAFSVVGVLISVSAVLLQGVSDIQMQKFRNAHMRGFIRIGLWKYSRHPNYLGEILMWWGIAIAFVSAASSMWYLCLGALINTLMFLVVSIPMADKRQSKKEGFNEYKNSTRMLFPVKK